jgi:hypothetical protein
MKGRSNGSGVDSGQNPLFRLNFARLKKLGCHISHPALEVLFRIMTKLGQQPSILTLDGGFSPSPSSSEKAGVLLPDELETSSEGWSVIPRLSMGS